MKTQANSAARRIFGFALGLAAASGCGGDPKPGPVPMPPTVPTAVNADRNADVAPADPLGETAQKVVYLDQGWTPELSQKFYFTSQGSQVVPYEWFLALEQPDQTSPFRDGSNMLRFRYLTQKPDSMNPDGLPVGFARDDGKDRKWLGFTCAACHTNEIHYKGTAYRIDGGPSLSDVQGFLLSLAQALTSTREQADKFDRFATKVLAGKDSPAAREALKGELSLIIARRNGYNRRNFPAGNLAGNGRIDALGAILNEVFHHVIRPDDVVADIQNTRPATAPVSLPFLWDTPQHDKLQWVGAVQNGGPANIGSLGRNVGETLGVFADLQIQDGIVPTGYRSSVQVQNLRALEDWVTSLWSPLWPADFPPIDAARRDQGRTLFVSHCLNCHNDIKRTDPDRKIVARMFGTGTDALTADNFWNRTGSAGMLEGGYSKYFPLVGDKFAAEASGPLILDNAVIGTIVGSAFPAPKDQLTAFELAIRPSSGKPHVVGAAVAEIGPQYKGRPLNGIWATAPYLHNGSVPTLADLLKPAKDRPKSFSVGTRAFDPDRVGFQANVAGVFLYRVADDKGVTIPGNSNAGHEYGTTLSDPERAQLLEYLKSI